VLAIAHLSNEAIRIASCVDEIVQLGIRQRTVYVAVEFGVGAPDVFGAQEHFESASPSDYPRQSRHRPSTGDEAHPHFPLRQERSLTARVAHVAGEQQLTAVSGRPAPRISAIETNGGARQAHQDVGPCLEGRSDLAGCWSDPRCSRESRSDSERRPSTALSKTTTFTRSSSSSVVTISRILPNEFRTHEVEWRVVEYDSKIRICNSIEPDLRFLRC